MIFSTSSATCLASSVPSNLRAIEERCILMEHFRVNRVLSCFLVISRSCLGPSASSSSHLSGHRGTYSCIIMNVVHWPKPGVAKQT